MKNIAILFIAGCTLLASCMSMDIVPKTEGSSLNWYTTEQELKMATNEFYIMGYWYTSVSASDDWTDNITYRQKNLGTPAPLDGSLDGASWCTYDLWNQAYKLIARANSLLDNYHRSIEAGNMTEESVKPYTGQAYFARACKYADLIAWYGAVPYVHEYITIDEALKFGRTPKADLIPLVMKDFDDAISCLPVEWSPKSNRFSKGAAYAMKARFALNVASVAKRDGDAATAEEYFNIAAKAAKDCMDLDIYSLEPDYSKLFLTSTKQNSEKIFIIPRSVELDVVLDNWYVNNGVTRNAGGYCSWNPSWDLAAAYLCTDGKPIDESDLFDPENPFRNRDPRMAMSMVEFGADYGTPHLDYIYNPNPKALKTTKVSTGEQVENKDCRGNKNGEFSSYNGFVVKKGIDETWAEARRTGSSKVAPDYTIMRYADVLLMYAEAKIELDEIDNTVLEAINSVRSRAYGLTAATFKGHSAEVTSTDQATLRKAVRLERRVELAFEGSRYQDLIRWGLAEKALNGENYIYNLDVKEVEKLVNNNKYPWPGIPEIDEDGIADFSGWKNEDGINEGAKRVFPKRQLLFPIPTSDKQLVESLGQNDGY